MLEFQAKTPAQAIEGVALIEWGGPGPGTHLLPEPQHGREPGARDRVTRRGRPAYLELSASALEETLVQLQRKLRSLENFGRSQVWASPRAAGALAMQKGRPFQRRAPCANTSVVPTRETVGPARQATVATTPD